MNSADLKWQSKLVLLLVLPAAAASVLLQGHWWALNDPSVAIWTLGLSLLLGLIVLKLRAATPAGAFAGTVLTASLMFSTATVPYQPWRTALVTVLAVSLLAQIATRAGRARKERLGTAEKRHGRTAAQIAANLGAAALVSDNFAQTWLINTGWFRQTAPSLLLTIGLTALAEAAADTVSSEIGQLAKGAPRMITTLKIAEPGTDGAISLLGTLAGAVAAALVAAIGTLAMGENSGGLTTFWIASLGGIFGLFFDSLLGATLERRGWLNNDMVNFLSTASAAGFALAILGAISYFGH